MLPVPWFVGAMHATSCGKRDLRCRGRRPSREPGGIADRCHDSDFVRDVSIRAVGALAGGEVESAEISSHRPTPDVTPASAKP